VSNLYLSWSRGHGIKELPKQGLRINLYITIIYDVGTCRDAGEEDAHPGCPQFLVYSYKHI